MGTQRARSNSHAVQENSLLLAYSCCSRQSRQHILCTSCLTKPDIQGSKKGNIYEQCSLFSADFRPRCVRRHTRCLQRQRSLSSACLPFCRQRRGGGPYQRARSACLQTLV